LGNTHYTRPHPLSETHIF